MLYWQHTWYVNYWVFHIHMKYVLCHGNQTHFHSVRFGFVLFKALLSPKPSNSFSCRQQISSSRLNVAQPPLFRFIFVHGHFSVWATINTFASLKCDNLYCARILFEFLFFQGIPTHKHQSLAHRLKSIYPLMVLMNKRLTSNQKNY